jgi:hypothetical protein
MRCSSALSACLLGGLALAAISSRAAPSSPSAPPRGIVVPFIQDDFQRALTEARATHRPIFIEAWAPW